MKNVDVECQNVDELLAKLKTHKQEAVDCLIASRAAYEPTLDGIADVLERSYEVDTSRYELLYHREQPTFLPARWLDNQEQVYVIVRSSNGYVMVAFRGTFTLQDAIQDMKLSTVPVPFGEGRAHVGFAARALTMPLQLFMNLPRPGEKLVFTGHSLGGAVASLSALRVLEVVSAGDSPLSRDRVLCVTFGTAPFANRELAMYINARYRDRFYHLVSRHDFVPRAHNLFPKLFFPLAHRLAHSIRHSRHVQAAQRLLTEESMLPCALHGPAKQLEHIFSALCPATGFIDFVRDCIANDEDALFYGLCGYVLLFNPDARGAQSVVEVDRMENMTPGFCAEGKSALAVLFEHGLGNHYTCILRGLFDMRPDSNSTHLASNSRSKHPVQQPALSRSLGGAGYRRLNKSMKGLSTSIMPFLSDPASALLWNVARLLLLMVNNDIPCAAM